MKAETHRNRAMTMVEQHRGILGRELPKPCRKVAYFRLGENPAGVASGLPFVKRQSLVDKVSIKVLEAHDG